MENAIKKEVASSFRKSEKFAARVSMSHKRSSQAVNDHSETASGHVNTDTPNGEYEHAAKEREKVTSYFVDKENVQMMDEGRSRSNTLMNKMNN